MSASEAPRAATRMRPRPIVLGLLFATFAWALVIPLSLIAVPTGRPALVLALGLLLLGGALVGVLLVAVHRAPSTSARVWSVASLAGVSLALWLPLHSWADAGENPWAWLAGFAIAASALVTWQAGVATAILLGAFAAIGGMRFDESVAESLLTTFGCAAVAWGTSQVLVWLLRLLWAAQAGREAEAELVLAQERLRVGRELHDVLGHRLGIIALKAELAADLAGRDPQRSAAESEAIRILASETLLEARRAVHGPTIADLGAQLDAAELVFTSAGVDASIDGGGIPARLPGGVSSLLAVVVREAVTNILRHSDARQVSITLSAAGTSVTGTSASAAGDTASAMGASISMVVMNDGLRANSSAARAVGSGGSGLASLSARCAAAGARLTAGEDGEGRFVLRVDTAVDRPEPV